MFKTDDFPRNELLRRTEEGLVFACLRGAEEHTTSYVTCPAVAFVAGLSGWSVSSSEDPEQPPVTDTWTAAQDVAGYPALDRSVPAAACAGRSGPRI